MVERTLEAFETPSQRVFRPLLEHFRWILKYYFTEDAVEELAAVWSIHPLNMDRIPERSASWESISEEPHRHHRPRESNSGIPAPAAALPAAPAVIATLPEPKIPYKKARGPSPTTPTALATPDTTVSAPYLFVSRSQKVAV